MSKSENTHQLPASEAVKRQSIGQWKQMMTRYPLSSPWGLAFPALTTLSANGTIAWLVANGRMTPIELVVLVAIEAALLIGVAWAQSRFVPPQAREKNPMPMKERLGTLAFALVWLGGVYGIVLFGIVRSGDDLAQAAWSDPITFLGGSNLKWPLLITLIGAAVDSFQDWAHFRRHGGTFLSTPGLQGAARWMTLFFGGIPFMVPLVAVLVAIKTVIEKSTLWWLSRSTGTNREARLATLVIPLAVLAFFGSMAWLLRSEVSLWAVGYCSAKFVCELFIVCLPLIASTAHAEEVAASKQPRRKKRSP